MDSQDITRPTRSSNPPKVYTPSVTRSHENNPMTYILNAKKALDKKIESTDRDHSYNIKFKEDRTYRLYTKTSKSNLPEVNKQLMIVEESLSIKNKNTSLSRRQLFRINMFNTTCRIDANGYMLQTFIQEDLHKICQELQSNKSCSHLNEKIKQMCLFTIGQINNPQNGQSKAILSAKPILNTTVPSNANDDTRVNAKDICTMKEHPQHLDKMHTELNDSNNDIDIHNHQSNSPYKLMTIMDKDLTNPCCTYMNNLDNQSLV
ncbi:unnamed protein product [Mytilus coruscus]|uniref:Uncharacterized protein n=1 Tax=Mytilus coruscus TaxID=42192 RepID=A0A6J8A1B3_MYTCO|nr:unnamed protein product [Mytilus coruscus]